MAWDGPRRDPARGARLLQRCPRSRTGTGRGRVGRGIGHRSGRHGRRCMCTDDSVVPSTSRSAGAGIRTCMRGWRRDLATSFQTSRSISTPTVTTLTHPTGSSPREWRRRCARCGPGQNRPLDPSTGERSEIDRAQPAGASLSRPGVVSRSDRDQPDMYRVANERGGGRARDARGP